MPPLRLLALLLAAPAAAAPPPADTARAFLAALAAHDRGAAAALVAPDAVFEYPFDASGRNEPRRFVGRDAVLAGYVDAALARLTRIGWTDQDWTVAADGRRVFLEALGDMEIDGRTPYRNRYVLRFEVRDGRITGFREYLNPVTSAIATGTTTGPAKPPSRP